MTGRRPILLAAHPTVGHTSALRAIGAELRDGVGADLIAVFEAMRRPDAVEATKAELAEMARQSAEADKANAGS